MLDVDLARFLCACGLSPTPEAMMVARRLHDVGHLVVEVAEGGRPAYEAIGAPKPSSGVVARLQAARRERDIAVLYAADEPTLRESARLEAEAQAAEKVARRAKQMERWRIELRKYDEQEGRA